MFPILKQLLSSTSLLVYHDSFPKQVLLVTLMIAIVWKYDFPPLVIIFYQKYEQISHINSYLFISFDRIEYFYQLSNPR